MSWTGTLTLTTRGAGVICEHSQDPGHQLLDALAERRLPDVPAAARRFPLPLLARIYQRVIWIEAAQILAGSHASTLLTLVGPDGQTIDAPMSRERWEEWRGQLDAGPNT